MSSWVAGSLALDELWTVWPGSDRGHETPIKAALIPLWLCLACCAVAAGVLCQGLAASHPGTPTPEQTPWDHLAAWGTHRHTHKCTGTEGNATVARCTQTHAHTYRKPYCGLMRANTLSHTLTHTHSPTLADRLTPIPTYRAPLPDPSRGSPRVLHRGPVAPLRRVPNMSPPCRVPSSCPSPPCPRRVPMCPHSEAGSAAGSAAAAPWTAPAPPGWGRGSGLGVSRGGWGCPPGVTSETRCSIPLGAGDLASWVPGGARPHGCSWWGCLSPWEPPRRASSNVWGGCVRVQAHVQVLAHAFAHICASVTARERACH